jgi:hydrogenase large subunit
VFHCLYLLRQFRTWYEKRILGCSIDKWLEIRTRAELLNWVEQSAAHADSDLGIFIRFALGNGLDDIGRGCANFLSYALSGVGRMDSEADAAPGWQSKPGVVTDGAIREFDPQRIAEDVSHAWFADKGPPRHPTKGRTVPYASGSEDEKYSWTKAPRYEAAPCEAGPLAEALASGDPLFTDLAAPGGASVFSRELARLVRACHTIPAMEKWLEEIPSIPGKFYHEPARVQRKSGFGLVEAPRGALGHWVVVRDDRIANYQVITPTAWNASPKDAHGIMGPMEQALMGTPVGDVDHPVELYHVVRSFDPCLVCTVHAIRVD